MKNNTEDCKLFLKKSLQSLPDDFALSEVKSKIQMALNGIENLEKKRLKRETLKQKRLEIATIVSGYDPSKIILAIDEEIAKTKKNIDKKDDTLFNG
jgi:hypothetical protein